MKKPDLDSILKKSRLPEIPKESLELFPRRLVARLKRNEAPPRPTQRFLPRLAWASALAACVLMAFAIGHWSGRKETKDLAAHDSLANLKLIQETMALFPNRVRAVVQDEHGLKLVLADQPEVPASTPIYVRLCDGTNCTSLVTFSGQEIQIAGQTLTVLSQSDGGIILEGNKFIWSSNEPGYAGRKLKIEAKNLNLITM